MKEEIDVDIKQSINEQKTKEIEMYDRDTSIARLFNDMKRDTDINHNLLDNIYEYCKKMGIEEIGQLLSSMQFARQYRKENRQIDEAQIRDVICYASYYYLGEVFKPLTDVDERETISTGCAAIDKVLRGGIKTGLITEIAGEKKVGLKHIAIQIGLVTCLPREYGGVEGKTLYIANGKIPFDILDKQRKYLEKQLPGLMLTKERMKEKFYFEKYYKMDDFENFVNIRLPYYVTNQNIKTIIIGNIASYYRGFEAVMGKINAKKRAKHLTKLAAKLKEIAMQRNIAIVVMNEISAVLSNNNNIIDYGIMKQNDQTHPQLDKIKPALGNAWARYVNVSCLCYAQGRRIAELSEVKIKQLEAEKWEKENVLEKQYNIFGVLRAPYMGVENCEYRISNRGVYSAVIEGPTTQMVC